MRDYICTALDLGRYDGDIGLILDDDEIACDVMRVRGLVVQAKNLAEGAAEARLALMTQMRDGGYSYADIAGAAGVSKGRVSQLIGK